MSASIAQIAVNVLRSVSASSAPKPSRSASFVGRCGVSYQSANSSAPFSTKLPACGDTESRYSRLLAPTEN